jgi:hypothetical protein
VKIVEQPFSARDWAAALPLLPFALPTSGQSRFTVMGRRKIDQQSVGDTQTRPERVYEFDPRFGLVIN